MKIVSKTFSEGIKYLLKAARRVKGLGFSTTFKCHRIFIGLLLNAAAHWLRTRRRLSRRRARRRNMML